MSGRRQVRVPVDDANRPESDQSPRATDFPVPYHRSGSVDGGGSDDRTYAVEPGRLVDVAESEDLGGAVVHPDTAPALPSRLDRGPPSVAVLVGRVHRHPRPAEPDLLG